MQNMATRTRRPSKRAYPRTGPIGRKRTLTVSVDTPVVGKIEELAELLDTTKSRVTNGVLKGAFGLELQRLDLQELGELIESGN